MRGSQGLVQTGQALSAINQLELQAAKERTDREYQPSVNVMGTEVASLE